MTEAKPVRVALVGCGDISRAHLKAYQSVGLEIAALCDLDTSRAEKRRDEFNVGDVPIFDSHQTMLEKIDCDLVTVATPVAQHAPITIDCLKAGRHVACEKPSTLSLDENRAVIDATKAAGRKVIFFSSRMRWGPAVMARQFINDGALGKIYRVHVQYFRRRGRPGLDVIPEAHWFTNKKLAGGGIVMDMGQYFMDMVFDLTGWPKITSVTGSTFRGHAHHLPPDRIYDVEEHCSVFTRAGDELNYTFDFANFAHHPSTNYIMILGTEGGVRLVDKDFSYHTERGGPWRSLDTTTTWNDKTSGNDHVYAELVECVRGNDTGIGTTPEQALQINKVTLGALQSAEEHREITLD